MNKYNKEQLTDIVKESVSVSDVVRKLGLKPTGGNNNAYIKRLLVKFDIDITHFTGKHTKLGNRGNNKKHWSDVLVLRTDGGRTVAYRLRRALIESGREYRCELCGLKDKWNKKTLRLQVDHKNNNCIDDRAENLRFLCPNCHSQQLHRMNQGLTDILDNNRRYRYKRAQNESRPKKRIKTTHICKQCYKLTNNPSYCSYECSKKGQRRAEISNEEMFALLEKNNMNYSQTGRELGISDNAVKKRLKKAGLI